MSNPSNSLVIFLHGVGANGADLAPLADTLLPFLPAPAFASPDGPERFDGGGSGRQWFSVAGVTQANRAERVRHARAPFDRVVSSEIEKHGFAAKLSRIAFFGFSQGAIMALDAVATGRWPVRAVVAASGRLATVPEAKTEPFTKILVMHGENDPVIPAQELGMRRNGCELLVSRSRRSYIRASVMSCLPKASRPPASSSHASWVAPNAVHSSLPAPFVYSRNILTCVSCAFPANQPSFHTICCLLSAPTTKSKVSGRSCAASHFSRSKVRSSGLITSS